ncbi:hypothetical protein NVS83_20225 [Ancylobacter sp. GSK1Z-4-2]|nr:hypothetical protein [Ancylobacter mangrovi]
MTEGTQRHELDVVADDRFGPDIGRRRDDRSDADLNPGKEPRIYLTDVEQAPARSLHFVGHDAPEGRISDGHDYIGQRCHCLPIVARDHRNGFDVEAAAVNIVDIGNYPST